jgi:diadenylate cyclase
MNVLLSVGWVKHYLLPIIDICIIAFVIYKIYTMIAGTRAIQVVKGLALILVAAWVSHLLHLETVSWLLNQLIGVAALVLIILFQPELRRMLTRIGQGGFLGLFFKEHAGVIETLVQAVEELSNRRIGALLVLEMNVGLKNYIESGVKLDAALTGELLLAVLRKESPLHDGAVIIRRDRAVAAKCILPLTERHELLEGYGTRHLAALGLAEETDAVIVVVSETTGKISLASGGTIEMGISIKRLRTLLEESMRRQ